MSVLEQIPIKEMGKKFIETLQFYERTIASKSEQIIILNQEINQLKGN